MENLIFDEIGKYSKEEYAIVKFKDKYGVIDIDGNLVIPLIYNKIKPFKEHFFLTVTTDDYSYYLAKKGIIKKLDYTRIVEEHYGLVIVERSTPKYVNIKDPEERVLKLAEYMTNRKIGVINLQGDEVVPCNHGIFDIEINYEGIMISGVKYDYNGELTTTPFDPYEIEHRYSERCIVAKEICTGKYGFLDNKGNKICDFIYDSIEIFCGSIARVTINGKQGILDKNGFQVLPCLYTIKSFGNNKYDGKNNVSDTGYKIIYKDNKAGILNSEGKIIVPCKYFSFKCENNDDNVTIINNKFFIVQGENKKEGLVSIDCPETYFLKCEYDEVKFLLNIEKKSNCYYDDKDRIISIIEYGYEEEYEYVPGFGYDTNKFFKKESRFEDFVFSNEEPHYKYILAFRGEFIQVINSEINVIVLPFSEEARVIEIVLGDYVVYKHVDVDKITYKIYSIAQKKQIPFEYDNIGYVGNKYLQVQSNGKWGLFDLKSGKEFLPCRFFEGINYYSDWGIDNKSPIISDWFMFINNDIAVININGKYGFININGEIIAECKYDRVLPFSEGMAAVCNNSRWGFINKNGKLIANNFDKVRIFSESLAAVKLNGKWGYINNEGSIIIPFIYNDAYDFKEGLAAVSLEKKYGFINKDNRNVIPFWYNVVSNFHQGEANIMTDSEYGKILKDGSRLSWSNKYKNRDYRNHYASDTWNALTDGMYGDFPGGEIDYDIIGF